MCFTFLCINAGADKDGSNKQESSKSRPDLSALIFEQLTLPLRDGQGNIFEQSSTSQSGLPESVNTNDPSTEINVSLIVY